MAPAGTLIVLGLLRLPSAPNWKAVMVCAPPARVYMKEPLLLKAISIGVLPAPVNAAVAPTVPARRPGIASVHTNLNP